ncbi:MAG: hypothetical protein ABL964_00505 [Steroidobacteraceae bacterium]
MRSIIMSMPALQRLALSLLVTGSALGGFHSALAASVADVGPVPAVWKEQQIRFYFVTQGSAYSCNAIQTKLRALLTDLGAGDGLSVNVKSCTDGIRKAALNMRSGGRGDDFMLDGATTPLVTITIRSLVPETPDALAALNADRGTAGLRALVRHEGALDQSYASAVAGEWKQVRLSDRTRYLDASDCDLLQQVRAQVFAKLAVRVVKDSGTCQRRSVSLRLGGPNLHVEALVPVHREPTVNTTG